MTSFGTRYASPGSWTTKPYGSGVAACQQRQRAEAIVGRVAGNGSAPSSVRRRRVLVVDDDDDNREMAAIALEHAGFEAMTATNGLEAVIAAHLALAAVVLMDVSMAVLDGVQAVRLLKASEITRHVNVIAHTARADFPASAANTLFDDVLGKPIDPRVMVASVRRFARP